MRKTSIFSVLLVSIALTALLGCAVPDKTVKLQEFKAHLDCLVYEGETQWKDIEGLFGEPDRTPLPTGESLSRNTRIYENKVIIFHTERKKIKVEGNVRYEEVVTKVEICKRK